MSCYSILSSNSLSKGFIKMKTTLSTSRDKPKHCHEELTVEDSFFITTATGEVTISGDAFYYKSENASASGICFGNLISIQEFSSRVKRQGYGRQALIEISRICPVGVDAIYSFGDAAEDYVVRARAFWQSMLDEGIIVGACDTNGVEFIKSKDIN